jgi:hypothetical protein
MSLLITAVVVLLLPWLYPQLDSWSAIWSPYPHGWWIFLVLVLSASLMLCKIIKSLPSLAPFMREIRRLPQYKTRIADLETENRNLKAQLKREEIKIPIAGKM